MAHQPSQVRFSQTSTTKTEPVDLAFLFASPLVYRESAHAQPDGSAVREQIKPLRVLNLRQESQLLMNILSDAGKRLVVRREVATVEKFRYLVTRGCKAFHYSGHGYQNCIGFEDEIGCLHDLEVDVLKQLFAAGGTSTSGLKTSVSLNLPSVTANDSSLAAKDVESMPSPSTVSNVNDSSSSVKFVFVSSCYSEGAGGKFVEAGVSHVVAVDSEQRVEDSAAQKFAVEFYHMLVRAKSVQNAFDAARATVAAMQPTRLIPNPKETASRFLLLPENTSHDEVIFANLEDSTPIEECPTSAALPPYPDSFIGRNVDLHQLISLLKSGRFYTVCGELGVGKSCFALALAHWLLERRVFSGGTCWVEASLMSDVIHLMPAISAVVGAADVSVHGIVQALNQRGEVFVVIDDCDSLVSECKPQLLKLLGDLLRHAGGLHLLLTLRTPLDEPAYLVAKGFQLNVLSSSDAAHLMSSLTRHPSGIRISEVLEYLGKAKTPVPRDMESQLALLGETSVMQLLAGNLLKIVHAAARFNSLSGKNRLRSLENFLSGTQLTRNISGGSVGVIENDDFGVSGRGLSSQFENIGVSAVCIEDNAGRQAWESKFFRRFSISWTEMVEELVLKYFQVSRSTVDELRDYLIDTRNPDDYRGEVTQESFATFLKWFGPFKACVNRSTHLLNKSWFHGKLSSEEATHLLRDKPIGTYLVRFSNSYRRSGGTALIGQPVENKYNPNDTSGQQPHGYRVENNKNRFYETFEQLVECFPNELKVPLHRRGGTGNYEAVLTEEDYVDGGLGSAPHLARPQHHLITSPTAPTLASPGTGLGCMKSPRNTRANGNVGSRRSPDVSVVPHGGPGSSVSMTSVIYGQPRVASEVVSNGANGISQSVSDGISEGDDDVVVGVDETVQLIDD